MNIKTYIGFAFVVMGLYSCDLTEELESGGTAVEEMAGDWFIKIYEEEVNAANLLVPDYYRISTYNTSRNVSTEIFLDDHETWPYKGVVNVNAANLTFGAGAGGVNEYDAGLTAAVEGGQVWKSVVKAASGTTTDSIQIRLRFSDHDKLIIYSGYRRTGFPEDEH